MADTTHPKRAGKRLRARIKWVGICLLILTVAVSVSLAKLNMQHKEEQTANTLAKQQELLASSRVELISTWLGNLAQQGDRLISSDMFRLFAAEVNVMDGDLSALLTPGADEGESDIALLAQQMPMMRNLLNEFVSYSGFIGGRIINRQGQTYLATDASTTPLTPVQGNIVGKVFVKSRAMFSPLRKGLNGLILDVFIPIFPPQYDSDDKSPVAVLMLSRIVSGKLGEFIAQTPTSGQESTTRLVQRVGTSFVEIAPWLPEGLHTLRKPLPIGEDGNLAFEERIGIQEQEKVYSLGLQIPTLEWWVIQETDYHTAREELRSYSQTVIFIAGLIMSVLVLSIGGVWWWLISIENRKVADEFKDLANKIEEQKVFLDSINNTITDFIGLKDEEGIYRYVNPAFAKAVGRPVEEMTGLDDAAIFGFETARRLKNSDDVVRLSDNPVTVEETIFLQSTKYHVQVSKAPFFGGEVCPNGIVSVFRDITSTIEAQEQNKRVVRQTIAALVRTIEQHDPYLGGHSRMMHQLSHELANAMHLTEAEIATVEAGAYLSQVGKMFVPQAILNKPDTLTTEEKAQMEKHVEHAKDVLKDIDFDLPVVEAIYQMNEKLDGSGYPQKLYGNSIIMPAKILGLTNTFCALVRPRSYRPAQPVDVALTILNDLQQQYDPILIEKLKEILETPVGEKILQKAHA